MINILVVEDDSTFCKVVCTFLTKNGYTAIPASDGEQAMAILDREHIDLIVSDIMMPKMDGYELTRQLRDADFRMPILMMTAKDRFEDMQTGFLAGTDDYMVKPIDLNEMLLRIGALLRRAKIANEHRLTFGKTVLDYDSLTVSVSGDSLMLPQKEFLLLFKLLSYPGKIFTRSQLMDEIWGMDSETDIRTVDVHINRLREHFRNSNDFEIITVRGLGYKAVKKNA